MRQDQIDRRSLMVGFGGRKEENALQIMGLVIYP
jgi:hypothetical protein